MSTNKKTILETIAFYSENQLKLARNIADINSTNNTVHYGTNVRRSAQTVSNDSQNK
jgi:hypothetical protein